MSATHSPPVPGGIFELSGYKSCALGLERLIDEPPQSRDGSNAISAILVDLELPDLAGLGIVDRLFAAAPQIPIIVLCSTQDEMAAKEAIQRGAQDYLLKEHLDDYLLPKTLAGVIERASITEALFDEKERAQVTLNSIGDAVISTDVEGRVAYMNSVAERLTGWPLKEGLGLPLEQVFRSSMPDAQDDFQPDGQGSGGECHRGASSDRILIRRDGEESAIEDSSAPIHDRRGRITGAVMVFHDVSTARALTLKLAYMAQHDSLTDLPNRSLLNDRLGQAIGAAQRHHGALALLYLDLDRFKVINDSLGHSSATGCCSRSPCAWVNACVRPIPSAASAGMSS